MEAVLYMCTASRFGGRLHFEPRGGVLNPAGLNPLLGEEEKGASLDDRLCLLRRRFRFPS